MNMNRKISFQACFASSAFFSVLFFISTCVHAIVIDHECTDITAIPQSAIEQAKSTLHIAYGHTSHGSQITTGMTGLVEFANGGGLGLSLPEDIFAWNNGGTGSALDLHDYAMGGDVGYYPAWVNNTISYLEDASHADVNVIIWSWCGQVDDKYSAGTLESEYLTPMAQLENDYPGVNFIYMTGHVDIWDDADNKAANQMIRDYCIENDKILYDFADIERYDPDGNYFEFVNDNCDYYDGPAGNKLGNWATEWQDIYDEGSYWYSCGSAHSQPLNANQKAYAAWWLWATLAGWDSTGETVTWNVTFTAGTGGSLSGDTEQVVEDGGSTTAVEAVADSGFEFSGWTGDYVDTDNPLIISGVVSDMIVNSVFTDIEITDEDSDGIDDEEESGPGGDDFNYDGNSDGIPDNEQSNVASFFDVKGHYVTMAATAPAILTGVAPTNQDSTPEDTEFPYGLFSFTVEGESNPVVTIILPEDVLLDTYYKYGPTPDNTSPHWYEFMYDEESETGAVINDQTITLYFVDGERGDDDLDSTNFTVIDPGGPAVISEAISDDASSDVAGSSGDEADSDGVGGANGCFITSSIGEGQNGNLCGLIVLAIICAVSCIRKKGVDR